MSKRIWFFVSALLLLVAATSCYLVPGLRFGMEQTVFRLLNNDQPVITSEAIDQLLSEFPLIDQADLPAGFRQRTRIDAPEFRHLSPRKFFVIRKKDLYRKIVGDLRIHHLFALHERTMRL